MELSYVSKDKFHVILRVKNVGAGYINTLRRLMAGEVPVMAIEDVEIRKNSSALYDEIIAHRLGMLSIKTDQSYNIPSKCPCGGVGCASCQVKMSLSVKGPQIVYASQLQSKDSNVVPVHGKTPITQLLDGQELELEVTAILGRGIEHSKWNSGLVHFREYPHVTIGKVENAPALAGKYPQVLELKAGKLSVKEKAVPDFDLFEEIASVSLGAITIGYEDDYLLYVESWEQLAAKDIVTNALDRFNEELGELKKLAKEV
jgi:DNA-directed RNA polymerase subunit D